jgi:XRE family transcriptional regulator, regulator of sulfur utilization
MSQTLGAKIRAARLAAQLTQVQLAARVGIGQVSLSQIELGTSRPTVNTLFKIADALNVSLDLLRDENDSP